VGTCGLFEFHLLSTLLLYFEGVGDLLWAAVSKKG
jgi:hypothetical protein